MSVTVVNCENCGGSSSPVDSVCVDVTFSKHSLCDKCYNMHSDKQHHYFCTDLCFSEYMLKVINGEAKLEWKYR